MDPSRQPDEDGKTWAESRASQRVSTDQDGALHNGDQVAGSMDGSVNVAICRAASHKPPLTSVASGDEADAREPCQKSFDGKETEVRETSVRNPLGDEAVLDREDFNSSAVGPEKLLQLSENQVAMATVCNVAEDELSENAVALADVPKVDGNIGKGELPENQISVAAFSKVNKNLTADGPANSVVMAIAVNVDKDTIADGPEEPLAMATVPKSDGFQSDTEDIVVVDAGEENVCTEPDPVSMATVAKGDDDSESDPEEVEVMVDVGEESIPSVPAMDMEVEVADTVEDEGHVADILDVEVPVSETVVMEVTMEMEVSVADDCLVEVSSYQDFEEECVSTAVAETVVIETTAFAPESCHMVEIANSENGVVTEDYGCTEVVKATTVAVEEFQVAEVVKCENGEVTEMVKTTTLSPEDVQVAEMAKGTELTQDICQVSGIIETTKVTSEESHVPEIVNSENVEVTEDSQVTEVVEAAECTLKDSHIMATVHGKVTENSRGVGRMETSFAPKNSHVSKADKTLKPTPENAQVTKIVKMSEITLEKSPVTEIGKTTALNTESSKVKEVDNLRNDDEVIEDSHVTDTIDMTKIKPDQSEVSDTVGITTVVPKDCQVAGTVNSETDMVTADFSVKTVRLAPENVNVTEKLRSEKAGESDICEMSDPQSFIAEKEEVIGDLMEISKTENSVGEKTDVCQDVDESVMSSDEGISISEETIAQDVNKSVEGADNSVTEVNVAIDHCESVEISGKTLVKETAMKGTSEAFTICEVEQSTAEESIMALNQSESVERNPETTLVKDFSSKETGIPESRSLETAEPQLSTAEKTAMALNQKESADTTPETSISKKSEVMQVVSKSSGMSEAESLIAKGTNMAQEISEPVEVKESEHTMVHKTPEMQVVDTSVTAKDTDISTAKETDTAKCVYELVETDPEHSISKEIHKTQDISESMKVSETTHSTAIETTLTDEFSKPEPLLSENHTTYKTIMAQHADDSVKLLEPENTAKERDVTKDVLETPNVKETDMIPDNTESVEKSELETLNAKETDITPDNTESVQKSELETLNAKECVLTPDNTESVEKSELETLNAKETDITPDNTESVEKSELETLNAKETDITPDNTESVQKSELETLNAKETDITPDCTKSVEKSELETLNAEETDITPDCTESVEKSELETLIAKETDITPYNTEFEERRSDNSFSKESYCIAQDVTVSTESEPAIFNAKESGMAQDSSELREPELTALTAGEADKGLVDTEQGETADEHSIAAEEIHNAPNVNESTKPQDSEYSITEEAKVAQNDDDLPELSGTRISVAEETEKTHDFGDSIQITVPGSFTSEQTSLVQGVETSVTSKPEHSTTDKVDVCQSASGLLGTSTPENSITIEADREPVGTFGLRSPVLAQVLEKGVELMEVSDIQTSRATVETNESVSCIGRESDALAGNEAEVVDTRESVSLVEICKLQNSASVSDQQAAESKMDVNSGTVTAQDKIAITAENKSHKISAEKDESNNTQDFNGEKSPVESDRENITTAQGFNTEISAAAKDVLKTVPDFEVESVSGEKASVRNAENYIPDIAAEEKDAVNIAKGCNPDISSAERDSVIVAEEPDAESSDGEKYKKNSALGYDMEGSALVNGTKASAKTLNDSESCTKQTVNTRCEASSFSEEEPNTDDSAIKDDSVKEGDSLDEKAKTETFTKIKDRVDILAEYASGGEEVEVNLKNNKNDKQTLNTMIKKSESAEKFGNIFEKFSVGNLSFYSEGQKVGSKGSNPARAPPMCEEGEKGVVVTVESDSDSDTVLSRPGSPCQRIGDDNEDPGRQHGGSQKSNMNVNDEDDVDKIGTDGRSENSNTNVGSTEETEHSETSCSSDSDDSTTSQASPPASVKSKENDKDEENDSGSSSGEASGEDGENSQVDKGRFQRKEINTAAAVVAKSGSLDIVGGSENTQTAGLSKSSPGRMVSEPEEKADDVKQSEESSDDTSEDSEAEDHSCSISSLTVSESARKDEEVKLSKESGDDRMGDSHSDFDKMGDSHSDVDKTSDSDSDDDKTCASDEGSPDCASPGAGVSEAAAESNDGVKCTEERDDGKQDKDEDEVSECASPGSNRSESTSKDGDVSRNEESDDSGPEESDDDDASRGRTPPEVESAKQPNDSSDEKSDDSDRDDCEHKDIESSDSESADGSSSSSSQGIDEEFPNSPLVQFSHQKTQKTYSKGNWSCTPLSEVLNKDRVQAVGSDSSVKRNKICMPVSVKLGKDDASSQLNGLASIHKICTPVSVNLCNDVIKTGSDGRANVNKSCIHLSRAFRDIGIKSNGDTPDKVNKTCVPASEDVSSDDVDDVKTHMASGSSVTTSKDVVYSRSSSLKENGDALNQGRVTESESACKDHRSLFSQDPSKPQSSIISRITKAVNATARGLGKATPAAIPNGDIAAPLHHVDKIRRGRKRKSCLWSASAYSKRRCLGLKRRVEDGSHDVSNQLIRKCTVCGKQFFSLSRFSRHMESHSSGKNFCCNVCGKLFESQSRLDIHSQVHMKSMSSSFSCQQCGKMCKNWRTLIYHLSKHREDGGKKYTCELCSHLLTTPKRLQRHYKHHQKGLHHCCYTCGKLFSTQQRLDQHRIVHTVDTRLPTAWPPQPRRKPGRPRKTHTVPSFHAPGKGENSWDAKAPSASSVHVPKKRGRPPKVKLDGQSPKSSLSSPPKKRGRPPKMLPDLASSLPQNGKAPTEGLRVGEEGRGGKRAWESGRQESTQSVSASEVDREIEDAHQSAVESGGEDFSKGQMKNVSSASASQEHARSGLMSVTLLRVGGIVRKSSRKRWHARQRCTCCTSPTSSAHSVFTYRSQWKVSGKSAESGQDSDGEQDDDLSFDDQSSRGSCQGERTKEDDQRVGEKEKDEEERMKDKLVRREQEEKVEEEENMKVERMKDKPRRREEVEKVEEEEKMKVEEKRVRMEEEEGVGEETKGPDTAGWRGAPVTSIRHNVTLRECSVKLERSPELSRRSLHLHLSPSSTPNCKSPASAPTTLPPPPSPPKQERTSFPLPKSNGLDLEDSQESELEFAECDFVPEALPEKVKSLTKSEKTQKKRRASAELFGTRQVKIHRTASEKMLPQNLARMKREKKAAKDESQLAEKTSALSSEKDTARKCGKPKNSVQNSGLKKLKKKSYSCHICGANFRTDSDRKVHIGKHLTRISAKPTGDVESVAQCCRLSVQGSSTSSSLPSAEKQVYCCYRCGYSASTYVDLTKHMWRHSQKKFQCTVCFAAFAKDDTLQQHMKAHASTTRV